MNIDLTFKDYIKTIKNDLGKTEWITVFSKSSAHKDVDTGGYFSALISNDYVKQSLNDYSWDLLIGHGRPGFCFHNIGGKQINEYYRFSTDGIEPFMYWRNFSGTKPDYYEISEEFRLYFDLYEDRKNKKNIKFIHIDDNGDDNEVVIIEEDSVQVKLSYIKEFLAVKKMNLAIFFDFMRFGKQSLNELKQKEFDEVKKECNYIYRLSVRDLAIEDRKSQGWLMGKKLIAGLEDFTPNLWGKSESKKYEDFIIGIDADGREISHTCNEDKLANFFGKNPGAPNYLTPVFFKKTVLNKYYDNSNKYEVEDGFVHCKGAWHLRIDNNHSKYIIVFLGDLGHLHIKEQYYWKHFNITPQGGLSRTAWKRGFQAQFTDPEQPDLYFKYKFNIFQEAWNKRFGWYLFKPLSKDDDHCIKSLHIPTTDEPKEFDTQILSLAKIIIESLNEKELSKGLSISKENPKGLDKLEAFLYSKRASFPEMIKFLRNLQALKATSVSHRKSKSSPYYKKSKDFFEIGKKELSSIFEDVIIKTIWVLNTLENHFLKKNN